MSEVPSEFTMDSSMTHEALSPEDIEAHAAQMPDDTSPEFDGATDDD